MDYSKEDEEYDNYLPKRTALIYKEIESFESYELTHCIVYQMAVRNTEIKEKLKKCNRIRIIKTNLDKRYMTKYFAKPICVKREATLSKKMKYYTKLADTLTLELITQNLIYPDNFEIKNSGLENTLVLEKILKRPLAKYKTNRKIQNQVVISQGVEADKDFFDISNLQLKFKKQVYDTNQTKLLINFSLPRKETEEYLKHILDTIYSSKEQIIKTPKKLLGRDVKNSVVTENYPKNQTATKLADMFFVYDYVTEKLKNYTSSIQLLEDEYTENKENITNNKYYTTAEKKIQLQSLLEEHEENKTSVKLKDIFKDFDDPMEGVNFKSSTASNYYYALKPYIEERRYPEFLTGESIIEATEDKNDT